MKEVILIFAGILFTIPSIAETITVDPNGDIVPIVDGLQ